MSIDEKFLRVQDCGGFSPSFYSHEITASINNKKDLNLFRDCFSNHTNFIEPKVSELVYNDESERYIQRDNLSAYFVNYLYLPPTIYEYKDNQEINIDEFIKSFTDVSYSKLPVSGFNLGSNRIRYVIGDVGQGKSAFLNWLYCQIENNYSELDMEYKIISVYLNLEDEFHYSEIPISLNDKFKPYLYIKLSEGLASVGVNLEQISQINPSLNPCLAIKMLAKLAKENNFRFIIYIDNLDFYHYYYARYYFFENGNKQQDKSIRENIEWLHKILRSRDSLGELGMNIIIAERTYVYEEIVSKVDGGDPRIDTTEAVFLGNTPEITIIESRFDLLSKAIGVVQKKSPGAVKNIRDALLSLRIALLGVRVKDGLTERVSPLKDIYKLGHHGHRSLVHFLSSLSISYTDVELMDRFFHRQVTSLYTLYFNKIYQRYTQEKNHFPNMFLVDCLVIDGEFKEAHQPHVHTYWLKYLILNFIYINKENGVKFHNILDLFCNKGNYDDFLVRHVVGSLCTSNEFRCAYTKPDHLNRPLESRKIYPTDRGEMLCKEKEKQDQLCFDFTYLSVITDDMWLSFPKEIFNNLYETKSSFSHLCRTDNSYISESLNVIKSKSREVLYFLRVLEASFDVEIKKNMPDLYQTINNEGITPDFVLLKKHNIEAIRRILTIFGKNLAEDEITNLKKLSEKLNKNEGFNFDVFFQEYFQSGDKIEL